MATANIAWSPVSGATGYLIQYKEQSSSVWITPNSPANPTALTTYPITIDDDTYYDARIITQCPNGGKIINVVLFNNEATYIWVEDTYGCEQDEVFVLDTTVTGLSSPALVYYDPPQDRFYVIDEDDTTGNFWWFDPDTFTSSAGRNYLVGQPVFSPLYIQSLDVDKVNRRLLGAGPSTNGLVVYDIPTDTFSTVPYGTNGAFSRLLVRVLGNSIYCANIAGTPSITIINKNTLIISSTINISSIPSGTTYLTGSYGLNIVNGNIWVYAASSRPGTGNIAIYDSNFTTLIGTITIPGAATWVSEGGTYWQNHFYDEANDRWYAHDIGSNSFHVIDTTSNTVVHSYTFNNRQGKTNSNFTFVLNDITGDLYGSYTGLDDNSDTTQIIRFYKINRTTYDFESINPNQSTSSLTNRSGTNEFWAVAPGTVAWEGTPNWMTDGVAFKYLL